MKLDSTTHNPRIVQATFTLDNGETYTFSPITEAKVEVTDTTRPPSWEAHVHPHYRPEPEHRYDVVVSFQSESLTAQGLGTFLDGAKIHPTSSPLSLPGAEPAVFAGKETK